MQLQHTASTTLAWHQLAHSISKMALPDHLEKVKVIHDLGVILSVQKHSCICMYCSNIFVSLTIQYLSTILSQELLYGCQTPGKKGFFSACVVTGAVF